MPCRDGGADRRREQHRHVRLLPRVPCGDQALGVLEDLPAEGAPGLGLLRRRGRALAFHPALTEAHAPIVAEARRQSIGTPQTLTEPLRRENISAAGQGVGRYPEFAMFGLRAFDPVTIAVMGFGIVIVAVLTMAF